MLRLITWSSASVCVWAGERERESALNESISPHPFENFAMSVLSFFEHQIRRIKLKDTHLFFSGPLFGCFSSNKSSCQVAEKKIINCSFGHKWKVLSRRSEFHITKTYTISMFVGKSIDSFVCFFVCSYFSFWSVACSIERAPHQHGIHNNQQ